MLYGKQWCFLTSGYFLRAPETRTPENSNFFLDFPTGMQSRQFSELLRVIFFYFAVIVSY